MFVSYMKNRTSRPEAVMQYRVCLTLCRAQGVIIYKTDGEMGWRRGRGREARGRRGEAGKQIRRLDKGMSRTFHTEASQSRKITSIVASRGDKLLC